MHCGNFALLEIVTWEMAANQNTAFNKWTRPKQKYKRAKPLGWTWAFKTIFANLKLSQKISIAQTVSIYNWCHVATRDNNWLIMMTRKTNQAIDIIRKRPSLIKDEGFNLCNLLWNLYLDN